MESLWRYLPDQKGGHDIDHVRRVYAWAERLAAAEQDVDYEVLRPAVILHDICREEEDLDSTGQSDHALLGAARADEILRQEGVDDERRQSICAAIAAHRYSSDKNPPQSKEAKILFDADKLDGLGAVGVARLFMLAGQYGERLYVKPPEGFGNGARVFRISDLREYSANLEFIGKMRFVPERLFLERSKQEARRLLEPMTAFFALLESELAALDQPLPAALAAPEPLSDETELPAGHVILYTDGACKRNPGPGGWGYILRFGETEKEESGGKAHTTNNEMELTAVIMGLEALKRPCTVDLFSDSKYVIDALQKGWAKRWRQNGWRLSDKQPAKNQALWERLLLLTERHTLRPHWVKGHADNPMNNRCDELAATKAAIYDAGGQ